MSDRAIYHPEVGEMFRALRLSCTPPLPTVRLAAALAKRKKLDGLTHTTIWRLERGHIQFISPNLIKHMSFLYGADAKDITRRVATAIYGLETDENGLQSAAHTTSAGSLDGNARTVFAHYEARHQRIVDHLERVAQSAQEALTAALRPLGEAPPTAHAARSTGTGGRRRHHAHHRPHGGRS